MKKATYTIIILILGFYFFNSQALLAQEKSRAITKDEKLLKEKLISKESTLTWDKSKHVFGSIEHQKAVIAEFTFTNSSKAPVAITKVGTTCGCTSPSYPKEPIMPGKKGTIKLRFDAVSPGFFKKAAKIHFSDGSAKEIEIEGKVVVRRSNLK
ncbi:MAG: DUF1573 domain-containing protein [Bacteroidales bacterium]|nr:DUF1573 domain-containing protein [Bacteroidales bacterium]